MLQVVARDPVFRSGMHLGFRGHILIAPLHESIDAIETPYRCLKINILRLPVVRGNRVYFIAHREYYVHYCFVLQRIGIYSQWEK